MMLQVLADTYRSDVIVYAPNGPVVRVHSCVEDVCLVMVQCLGFIHFNHVTTSDEQPDVKDTVAAVTAVSGSVLNHRPTLLEDLALDDSVEAIIAHQRNVAVLCKLVTLVQSGGHVSVIQCVGELAAFLGVAAKLWVTGDGLLCVGGRAGDAPNVPVALLGHLKNLCVSLHALLNHAGRDKVVQVMRNKCFHPGIAAAVVDAVKTCAVCQCYQGPGVGGFTVYK